jgi:hypothetical protein
MSLDDLVEVADWQSELLGNRCDWNMLSVEEVFGIVVESGPCCRSK